MVETALAEDEYGTYGSYVEIDGGFYQIQVMNTGTKRITRTVLGTDEIPEDSDAVPVDTYPEDDRKPVVAACRFAISGARERESERTDTSPDRSVWVFRTIAADETSLLPTPQFDVPVCHLLYLSSTRGTPKLFSY